MKNNIKQIHISDKNQLKMLKQKRYLIIPANNYIQSCV